MICAIMQPTYIPWIGYFDLIDKVDIFVFYDDVQLAKRSWQVRNRIKSSNGEVWLTLPIKKTKKRDDLIIKEALLNNEEKWIKKHLNTIKLNYKKSKFFNEVYPDIENVYFNATLLSDFNIKLIKLISRRIGINTTFINSSSLQNIEGQKDFRLVQICKALQIKKYLSPQGSAEYINEKQKGGEFVNNNIELYYHNYKHPQYKQLYNNFIPYLGVLDLLFNEGVDNSLDIIRSGRLNNIYYKDL